MPKVSRLKRHCADDDCIRFCCIDSLGNLTEHHRAPDGSRLDPNDPNYRSRLAAAKLAARQTAARHPSPAPHVASAPSSPPNAAGYTLEGYQFTADWPEADAVDDDVSAYSLELITHKQKCLVDAAEDASGLLFAVAAWDSAEHRLSTKRLNLTGLRAVSFEDGQSAVVSFCSCSIDGLMAEQICADRDHISSPAAAWLEPLHQPCRCAKALVSNRNLTLHTPYTTSQMPSLVTMFANDIAALGSYQLEDGTIISQLTLGLHGQILRTAVAPKGDRQNWGLVQHVQHCCKQPPTCMTCPRNKTRCCHIIHGFANGNDSARPGMTKERFQQQLQQHIDPATGTRKVNSISQHKIPQQQPDTGRVDDPAMQAILTQRGLGELKLPDRCTCSVTACGSCGCTHFQVSVL